MTTPSHTIATTQPAARAEDLDDKQIGPGLYPNEVAVVLDTGELIAAYVEANPTDNNSGVSIFTSARLIDSTGQTQVQSGVQLVTEFWHSSNHDDLVDRGMDVLAKACMAAVLGEPVALVDVAAIGTEGQDGYVAAHQDPTIAFGSDLLANVSIRALIAVKAATPAINASSVLA